MNLNETSGYSLVTAVNTIHNKYKPIMKVKGCLNILRSTLFPEMILKIIKSKRAAIMGSVGRYMPMWATSISSKLILNGVAITLKNHTHSILWMANQKANRAAGRINRKYISNATAKPCVRAKMLPQNRIGLFWISAVKAFTAYAFFNFAMLSRTKITTTPKTKVAMTLTTTMSHRMGYDFLSAAAALSTTRWEEMSDSTSIFIKS